MNFLDAHSTLLSITMMYDKAIREYENKILDIQGKLRNAQGIIDGQSNSIAEMLNKEQSTNYYAKVEELSARIQEQAEVIAKHKNFVYQVSNLWYSLPVQTSLEPQVLEAFKELKSKL